MTTELRDGTMSLRSTLACFARRGLMKLEGMTKISTVTRSFAINRGISCAGDLGDAI